MVGLAHLIMAITRPTTFGALRRWRLTAMPASVATAAPPALPARETTADRENIAVRLSPARCNFAPTTISGNLRGFGQFVLGQPGTGPQLPQQPAETRSSLLGHRPVAPSLP